jgi:hypothetical protein
MRVKKLPKKPYDVIKIAGFRSVLNQSGSETWTCLIWILIRIWNANTDSKQGLAIALFHFEKCLSTTLGAFTQNPNSSFWELFDPDLYPNYDVDPNPLNTGQEYV